MKAPVAHPKSMEMPMENKPHPEEWTEEWYKPWKAPDSKSNSRSVDSSYSGSSSRSGTTSEADCSMDGNESTVHDDSSSYIGKSGSSHSSDVFGSCSTGSDTYRSDIDESSHDDDDDSLEDTPQCGVLINVKPKIGERITRIHPDYTSQLRHSRWRKKYFPRGAFPYK